MWILSAIAQFRNGNRTAPTAPVGWPGGDPMHSPRPPVPERPKGEARLIITIHLYDGETIIEEGEWHRATVKPEWRGPPSWSTAEGTARCFTPQPDLDETTYQLRNGWVIRTSAIKEFTSIIETRDEPETDEPA